MVMFGCCGEGDIINCDFVRTSSRRAASRQVVLAVELLEQLRVKAP